MDTQREIKRGDVWYVSYDPEPMYPGADGKKTGRPGVVLMSDDLISKGLRVGIIYLSTSPNRKKHYNPTVFTGRTSYALIDSLTFIDQRYLTSYVCRLTDEEMSSIEAEMIRELGLNSPKEQDDSADKIANLEAAIETHKQETELYKRAYENVMDRLVNLKVETDLKNRMNDTPGSVEVKPAPVVAVANEPDPEPELVDINRCEYMDLRNLGFGIMTSDAIIAARPFLKEEDLKRVDGVTKQAYQLVQRKITVGNTAEFKKKPERKPEKKVVEPAPVEPKVEEPPVKKVNVNTATVKEIMSGCGMNQTQAYAITGYRKKHGRFASLEDLLNVPKIFPGTLKKYRDMLEV